MIFKQLMVFILCYTLAFPNTGLTAAPSTNPFAFLVTQHREIKTGVGSMDLVTKHGAQLADATLKILADPKNKKFLNTPEGLELRRHQQMLANFLAVKNHLEKCVKDKEGKRKLQERVLQSSFQSITNINDVSVPCLPEATKMSASFLDFNNGVMKAMKNMVRPYFQNQLSKQVITNTAKSLLTFKLKFKPDFMSKGHLTQKELDEVIGEVCLKKIQTVQNLYQSIDVCKKMDPLFLPKLTQTVIDYSKTQKSSEKMTPQKATDSLNESIDRLNKSLSKIKVKKDSGYIFDSADLTDDSIKKDFDQYANQYMSEVSQGAGTLLLTSTIKDEAGGIKSFDSSDTQKNSKTKQFQFVPHKKVSLSDVQVSIREVETKMMNQAKDAINIVNDATKKKGVLISDEDDIADLVKINPFAAGQVLIREPQYAGLMCDSINKINQDDVNDKKRDTYFFVGSAILGGALLLTGVGTMAGSYILSGSFSALSGTVLGYTALAGTANELVALGYQGKRALDNYQEMNRLEGAYLTQNSDSQAINQAKDALIEFKEARLLAGISFVGLGMNVLNAGRLFNILKTSSSKVSPDEIKAASKIMKYISGTTAGKRLKEISLLMGEKAMDKIDYFLLNLTKSGEINRLKFLELLSDSKIVPAKIKTIIEDSLEAIKNCEKI
jgi:hypothetical protein